MEQHPTEQTQHSRPPTPRPISISIATIKKPIELPPPPQPPILLIPPSPPILQHQTIHAMPSPQFFLTNRKRPLNELGAAQIQNEHLMQENTKLKKDCEKFKELWQKVFLIFNLILPAKTR